MNEARELGRAKWLMGCVGIFLVSTCVSFQELAYLINGHDGEANITKVYESQGRRGRTNSLTVEYQFQEKDGKPRKGMESVPLD